MVSLKNETIIPSKDLGLHHLDKPKHFIGAFIGIVVVTIGHLMIGNEMFTPKLINLKSALIHIKMDIAFLKIRRAGFPDHRLGMQRLNRKPCAVADSLGMLFRGNKQDLQFVVVGLLVYFQNDTTDISSPNNDTVGLAVRSIDASFNCFSGDYLPIKIQMIIPLTKLQKCAILERSLIIQNKLLPVIRGQRDKDYICVLHNKFLPKN